MSQEIAIKDRVEALLASLRLPVLVDVESTKSGYVVIIPVDVERVYSLAGNISNATGMVVLGIAEVGRETRVALGRRK